eukprot:COSAG02_NODE_23986_length_701_cov_4.262458_2_plen_77_part_01
MVSDQDPLDFHIQKYSTAGLLGDRLADDVRREEAEDLPRHAMRQHGARHTLPAPAPGDGAGAGGGVSVCVGGGGGGG